VLFSTIGIDDVKHVRKAFGVTVNDVVVAVCTGALRRYLAQRDALPRRSLVAAVPTSERTEEHGASGNAIGTMMYGLPVHVDDVVERLLAVQQSAVAAKALSDALGPGLMSGLSGFAPPQLIAPMARLYSQTRLADRMPVVANVLVSNVRGPEFPLFVRDARLEQMYPLGPLLEGVGLNLTVVSYVDRIHFGLIGCPDVVGDLAGLRDALAFALDELLAVS
jgi:WS/DGAT/MGAT family acyltransferase